MISMLQSFYEVIGEVFGVVLDDWKPVFLNSTRKTVTYWEVVNASEVVSGVTNTQRYRRKSATDSRLDAFHAAAMTPYE